MRRTNTSILRAAGKNSILREKKTIGKVSGRIAMGILCSSRDKSAGLVSHVASRETCR